MFAIRWWPERRLMTAIQIRAQANRRVGSEQCQQRTATGISTEIRLVGHRPFGNSQRTSTSASLFHEAYCRWATATHVRMAHIRQTALSCRRLLARTRVLQIDLNWSPASRKTTVSFVLIEFSIDERSTLTPCTTLFSFLKQVASNIRLGMDQC